MRRLRASDALCLYQEDLQNEYMHSLRIAMVDLQGRSSAELQEVMARVYSSVEAYHWRVEPVPLHLHHPLWRIDPDFEVRQHIHRIACPAPGGDRELAELLSDLAGGRLDRGRPLWSAWIVEGLADGRCALVTKVHHALADGVATGYMALEACQSEAVPLSSLPAAPTFPSEVGVSARAHLAMAASDVASHLSRAVPTLIAHRRAMRDVPDVPARERPASFSEAPPLSLNKVSGRDRTYAFTSFSLEDLRPLQATYGMTLNDLYLAMGAGALRRLLQDRGELPDKPLVACIPVSTRPSTDQSSSGNFLGTLAVRLHSELADPSDRVALTKREADLAKADFRRSVGARAEDYLDCLPPIAHALLLRGLKRQVRRGKPMMGNLGMSNVPGPAAPLYVADFKIEALYGVGPLAAGHGLNITAWTYAGRFNVSFLASSDSLPDLWPFVGHFRTAFEEIRECSAASTSARD